jgi:hypothetical protein
MAETVTAVDESAACGDVAGNWGAIWPDGVRVAPAGRSAHPRSGL